MIDDALQDRAVAFVAGSMPAKEREEFEVILTVDDELRALVDGLEELGAVLTLAAAPSSSAGPSAGLKERICGLIEGRPQRSAAEGLVISGPNGDVHWINPAFTAMCGYTLEELRGKSLGPILQGADTDQEAADRMRKAVHEYRPCRETILNYHKDGTPYWVEVAITPVYDEAGAPRWLVARERELTGYAAQ